MFLLMLTLTSRMFSLVVLLLCLCASENQPLKIGSFKFPPPWGKNSVQMPYPIVEFVSRELKQPRRRRQQERHNFAYLTMKNSTFARFARAFFIFGHLADVLDLSTTWNDLFCSRPDDVSIWWQVFNFVSLPLKRWFQFNSRIVWTHFASVMTLNNSEMIAEMRSYIFIWRSCCRRRRVCLNSLVRCRRRLLLSQSTKLVYKHANPSRDPLYDDVVYKSTTLTLKLSKMTGYWINYQVGQCQ